MNRTTTSGNGRAASVAVAAVLALCVAGGFTARAATAPQRTDFSKRVGIVFSAASANRFYSQFAYSTLFMAMQQNAMMAGVPFDLLTEDDLTDVARLVNYDALVFPYAPNVPAAKLAAIEAALRQAVGTYHIGIVTCGNFLTNDENGGALAGDPYLRLKDLLGVRSTADLNGVAATLLAETVTHPVMRGYAPGETIFSWSQLWLNIYEPVAGQTATVLAKLNVSGVAYNAVLATQTGGRNVHFANPAVLGDPNLGWSALQWVVFGDQTPVGLRLGRNKSVVVSRTDMDESMFASAIPTVEVPLYGLLADWKNRYNFVGSFYINVGNDPANGRYTDWSVSGPLYANYMALGNKIGTHSWTHPFDTATLTAAQLEFEFNQSKNEIAAHLGVPVLGAAIPGNPESLAVDEQLNQYFAHLSGRYANLGSGYHGAFGYLTPAYSMIYFTLSLYPDYSLIHRGYTPEQAAQFWRDQYTTLLQHASVPIVHWLWHDYGPTTGVSSGYSVGMYDQTMALAYEDHAEFATAADVQGRIKALKNARLTVTDGNPLTVTVTGTELGALSLLVTSDGLIQNVSNWYAYNSNSVFVPQNGGQFAIQLGATQDPVTRIVELPMRARLTAVTGNGADLDFAFEGEGVVAVLVNRPVGATVEVQGADAVTGNGAALALRFNQTGPHTASIRVQGNHPPMAAAQTASTGQNIPLAITLSGTDPDGDPLSYAVTSPPIHGTLSGNAPNLTYTPAIGFVGADSFAFTVNDGKIDSGPATVSLSVTAINHPPVANGQTLATGLNTPLPVTLTGLDPDGDALSYSVVAGPAHGTLSGSAPNLTYTPATGYAGPDNFTFKASDGRLDSNPATVSLTIIYRLSNPAAGLTIDGSLADWAGLTSFGPDPAEVTGANNLLDWLECWMAHDATQFYLAYRNEGAITLNWAYNVYLDTDTNAGTGYRTGALGAEYLLQGRSVYRYTGTGTIWSWSLVGKMTRAVSGNTAEFAFPRSWLGDPTTFNLFFRGDNTAYSGGTTTDYYPDNASGTTTGIRFFRYALTTAVNHPPTASDQTVTTPQDTPKALTLTGTDADGDPLAYTVVSAPAHGALSGAAPSLSYTPAAGYSGADSFTFKVNDGKADSAVATVAITVTPVVPTGRVSNPVGSLTVDGSLADWATLTSFGPDPADVTGANNLLDWLEGWMAHDATKFYLAYQNKGPITLNWAYNVYLDTDTDASTGYKIGALGADYLVQGRSVYRYTGNGTSWSWTPVGTMTTAVSGSTAEVAFPRTWIGNPTNINLLFRGDNAAYSGGTTRDYYPDNVAGAGTGVRFFQYAAGSQGGAF